jgi:hypothetical protein
MIGEKKAGAFVGLSFNSDILSQSGDKSLLYYLSNGKITTLSGGLNIWQEYVPFPVEDP